MAWEKTVLDLAALSGVVVPRRRLVKVNGRHVLLLERFDRSGALRIGYMSALSMMQRKDREPCDYVDIAETFTEFAVDTTADLEQLWRRIAFSVAVHNTDDHLRNHGLLRSGRGWKLSLAFDINPNPDVHEQRVTSICGASGAGDELDGLMLCAAAFGVSSERARQVLLDVITATREWRRVAASNGIAENEIERFDEIFDVCRKQMAATAERGR